MRLRRLIKGNALLALRRHWCRAAAISLIMLIIWALFAAIEQIAFAAFDIPPFIDMAAPMTRLDDMPNVSAPAMAVMLLIGLLYLAAAAPVSLGAARWFYFLTDGKALDAIELFDSFISVRRFFRALWLWVLLFFKRAFWAALFLAPPATMAALGDYWRREASRDVETLLSTGLELLGIALTLLLGWFLLVWLRRYALAEYVIAADDSLSARQAIKRSARLARGRCAELLVLELSLIGWRLLGMLVLPRLFTAPYIGTVYSLYTRYLAELQKQEAGASEEERAGEKAEK